MTQQDARLAMAGFDYQPESWMESAACVGYPPEWWFAEASDPLEVKHAAKRICDSCPVRARCLDYAMSVESGFDRHGLYGGVTADTRRKLGKGAA